MYSTPNRLILKYTLKNKSSKRVDKHIIVSYTKKIELINILRGKYGGKYSEYRG